MNKKELHALFTQSGKTYLLPNPHAQYTGRRYCNCLTVKVTKNDT